MYIYIYIQVCAHVCRHRQASICIEPILYPMRAARTMTEILVKPHVAWPQTRKALSCNADSNWFEVQD